MRLIYGEGKGDLVVAAASTPLEVEIAARDAAWKGVFRDVEVVEGTRPGVYFPLFQQVFARCHLAANLLLSDAADFGVGALRNAYQNRKRKASSVFGLRGAFEKVPAIIVGAGPSLRSLKGLENKALIFAGGAAIDRIDVTPHFSAAIDKEGPMKTKVAGPFCFQSRLNPAVLKKVTGPLLKAPEGHFSFLRWLEGEEEPFDGGWTVGNFMTSLAVLFGCDPIVFVGMDFCYRDGKKYAGGGGEGEGLVETLNRRGEKVWTQRDWLMGAEWMGELIRKEGKRTFWDMGGEGLNLGAEVGKWEEIEWAEQQNLRERVKLAVEKLEVQQLQEKRWEEWKEGLETGSALVEEKLLAPLWEVWRHVFEREGGQMELHQMLFYERIRQECSSVFD
jgi:hypothetical protein